MSVVIRGFDKPSDCDYCTLQDYGYCNVLLSYINVEHGIDTRCPITEISEYKLKNGHRVVVAEQTENCSEKPNNCEPQTIRCPKCGRTDYIRDMEKDMGIKGSHYKYKCINCNTYIKTEPTISKMEQVDEPQTEPLPKTINGVRIADAVAWADKWLEDNSVSEMWDMIRTLRDATEWQDEPQTERSSE